MATNPAKDWAKEFEGKDTFTQIQILHGLYTADITLEVKSQISDLLSTRLFQFVDFIVNEDNKIKRTLAIKNGIIELKNNEVKKQS